MKSKNFAILVILCCLAGCGQKGALYKEDAANQKNQAGSNQTEQPTK